MDPRVFRQWSFQPRRFGGRAIPGLISKAEQMTLPGATGVRQGPSTFKMPAVGEAKPPKTAGPEAFRPSPTAKAPEITAPKAVVASPVKAKPKPRDATPVTSGVSGGGPNIVGAFGTGVALGQTAASGMGMAHQLGIVGGVAAGKLHGITQPQDTDRDRQMRDAHQQRSEQLMIMRRQAGAQSSMKSVTPLVISGVRRFR